MPRRVSYWSGTPDHWDLVTKVQEMKREIISQKGYGDPIRSDDRTMRNPVTGREVSAKDLQYAVEHMQEIYESGMIREDRWSFLWYH